MIIELHDCGFSLTVIEGKDITLKDFMLYGN